ncbi:MAG: NADH-ubiquinone oxidoreductase-F iron-sulfur binding region domain-containing protein [Candidatus Dormibacteria bacterium]
MKTLVQTDTDGLLGGPPARESYGEYVTRLGSMPNVANLISLLEDAGLRGRSGSGFPTHRKWKAVAERSEKSTVVVVNGSEGEPLSRKDRALFELRPHLVIEGAVFAAHTLNSREIIIAVNGSARRAVASVQEAVAERMQSGDVGIAISVLSIPDAYVSGEESALVRFCNGDDAIPTLNPPYPFQRGVRGLPTLVNNAETMAMVALIARNGAEWYREQGSRGTAGLRLVTLLGAVAEPGVYEVPVGLTLAELASEAGGLVEECQAVLIGGFEGAWHAYGDGSLEVREVAGPTVAGIGCGTLVFLPDSVCGLVEVDYLAEYLAGQSAQQCGPCIHGLAAVSNKVEHITRGHATEADLHRLELWETQLQSGRGACHHPDGAIRVLRSGMKVFQQEVHRHVRRGACEQSDRDAYLAVLQYQE